MEFNLFGGDSEKIEELAMGDMFTMDLLHEAIGKVFDGKHKIKIYLPTKCMETFQTSQFFFLKPVGVVFDKDFNTLRSYGIEIAKIIVVYQKPKKIPNSIRREYVVTKIICGHNTCNIYTTTE